jgi:cell division cycle 20-like protein 1 (cofactor of APC complex)
LIWDLNKGVKIRSFSHKAAVKGLAWSGHQHGLIVSGGGTSDKTVKVWNIHTAKLIC